MSKSDARKAYEKSWRERNKERLRESQRSYRKRNLTRVREMQREWSAHPDRRARSLDYQKSERGREIKWATKIKKRHGLTREQHRNLIESQGGLCPGCGEKLESRRHTHVDHDHTRTRDEGNIRGVLCTHCNRALGAVRDRPDVLRNLISYLEVRQCGA